MNVICLDRGQHVYDWVLPSSIKTSDRCPKSASKSGEQATHEHNTSSAKSGVNILKAVMPRVAGGDVLSESGGRKAI